MKSKSSAKHVLFNSSLYSITSFLQKGISFILIPLYTFYLTPEDYGITGVVNSITQLLSLLFTLSLNGAIQRFYYKYQDDLPKLQSFNGTIVLFVVINSIILSSLIILFKDILIAPYVEGIGFYPYIFLGILTVVFNPIYTIFQSVLQTMERAKEFSINSLLYFFVQLVFSIVLIMVLKMGATGQLLSALIVAVMFGIYSVINLYRKDIIRFKFDKHYLKEALNYSVPLLPHLMSMNIANLVSRLFLNNQVSTASAGLFNIASQFMALITIIQSSVNSAYIPWFYGLMDQGKEQHHQVIKFADAICKLYLIINIGMSLFFKELLQIFTPEGYLLAWMYIPILAVAYQIYAIYLFYVNTLFYNTKATRVIFIASLSGSVLNVMISALFTREIGLLTPAIAFLIQQIFTTIIVVILSKKIEPVAFKLGSMVGNVILLALVSMIGLFYDIGHPDAPIIWQNLIYKLVIFVSVTFVLVYKYLPQIKTGLQQFMAGKKKVKD